MAGSLVFAWESPTWGGGIAFHDADAPGETLSRAYLLTRRQLSDVLEQEMWRDPGADHDLAPLLESGRLELGPGRYESLRVAGLLAGHPVVTIGCADPRALGLRAPAAPYVATIARGLRAAHGLSAEQTTAYLAGCPGVTPGWTLEQLDAVIRETFESV